jgi:RND family efflux transporter MFP subunit
MRSRTFLAFLSGALVLGSAGPPAVLAQQGPARVVVAQVSADEVEAGQTFVGTVMPLRLSTVGSAAAGRVEEFLVNEGDQVKQGQPLARLRTRLIEAELKAARAELASRQAEVKEAETALPTEKEQARARLDLAQATLALRRSLARRTETAGRASSAVEIEEALSLTRQGEAAAREAEAALKLLDTRKEKVDHLKAKAEAAQAEVERLEEQLARHTIVAPFDGYVIAEHTEVGAWLKQGDPVTAIAELKRVDIEVWVLEDHVSALGVGTSARVEVAALAGKTFVGEVALIVPQANARTRTFPVKVRVPNEERGGTVLLKAGMFTRVTLPTGQKEHTLLVPKDALVLDGSRRVVFVVEGGKVQAVPVDLGVAKGGLIQVKGSLQQGQQVVVQGNERLRPGQEVEVVRSEGEK